LFPGVTDNAEARECAQTITLWTPLPVPALTRRRRNERPGPEITALCRFWNGD
jgi:hypothetical protein